LWIVDLALNIGLAGVAFNRHLYQVVLISSCLGGDRVWLVAGDVRERTVRWIATATGRALVRRADVTGGSRRPEFPVRQRI